MRLFGIPQISARRLAFFRAFLGAALLLILIFYDPIRSIPLDQQTVYSPVARPAWLHTVAASGPTMLLLQIVACVCAVLFAIGIAARPAYTVLASILTLHVVMLLLRRGVHDWDLPLTTLLAWLVVPWGDAPPLPAVFRSRMAGEQPIRRAYGFAIWLPGLTLGLAFAAAAYAKLQRSGFEWIANGTVRYHFVEDGAQAASELGLWIATQPGLAVGLSLAAVLAEALFILVVFVRRWQARATFGAIGAGIFAGFYLFQGVRWWPWWMLFAAFLPWNRHERDDTISTHRDLHWGHAGAIAILVAAQAWASYRQIEVEPFLSNYPMYANTYDSPADYDAHHVRIRFEANGTDVTSRVQEAGGSDALTALAEGGAPADGEGTIAAFAGRYAGLYGSAPAAIDVVGIVERPFDWVRGAYLPPSRRPIGTVRLPDSRTGVASSP